MIKLKMLIISLLRMVIVPGPGIDILHPGEMKRPGQFRTGL
jgi:hypothetical protein